MSFFATFRQRTRWRGLRTWWLWLLIIPASLLILLLAARLHLEAYARRQLIARVHTASQGRYHLAIAHLQLNLLQGSVRLQGLVLSPSDSLPWPDSLPRWSVRMRSLHLRRANYWHLWREGRLHLAALVADSLALRMDPASKPPKPDSTDAWDRTLQRSIGRTFRGGLQVDQAAIRNLNLVITGQAPQTVDSLDLTLLQLRIDSTATRDSTRLWFTRELHLSVARYTARTRDSLYQWALHRIRYHHPQQTLHTGTIRLQPTLAPRAFAAALPYHTDRYALTLDSLRATGLNPGTDARHARLALDTLHLHRPRLDIRHDKRHRPEKPKPRRYPHETLSGLDVPIHLAHIHIHDGSITYTEWNPGAPAPLRLRFTQLQAHLQHLAAGQTLRADIHASFLNNTPLHLRWTYPLVPGPFRTYLSGTLGAMPATAVNPLLIPGQVQVENGQLRSLRFGMTVQNDSARGWLLARYDKLIVQVNDPATQRRKPLLTALANLVIANRNAAGQRTTASDSAAIAYRREPRDGLPRFLWRSVKSGLVATLLPPKAAQKATPARTAQGR